MVFFRFVPNVERPGSIRLARKPALRRDAFGHLLLPALRLEGQTDEL